MLAPARLHTLPGWQDSAEYPLYKWTHRSNGVRALRILGVMSYHHRSRLIAVTDCPAALSVFPRFPARYRSPDRHQRSLLLFGEHRPQERSDRSQGSQQDLPRFQTNRPPNGLQLPNCLARCTARYRQPVATPGEITLASPSRLVQDACLGFRVQHTFTCRELLLSAVDVLQDL